MVTDVRFYAYPDVIVTWSVLCAVVEVLCAVVFFVVLVVLVVVVVLAVVATPVQCCSRCISNNR